MLGDSPALLAAMVDVEMYAPEAEPLVIVGRTGVGKGLLVRRLHTLGRPGRPLVTVSGAELSPTLYQSQLYGHVRGAFTGAAGAAPGFLATAEAGTLFIDELHLVDKVVQGALLRALQDRTWTPLGGTRELQVGCRFVFATHRPIDELMQTGTLLADLRWRLGEAVIAVPDLLERLEDLPDLAEGFLARKVDELGLNRVLDPVRFSVLVMARLLGYPWAGNIRELENVIREAALRATFRGSALVEVGDLPRRFRTATMESGLRPEARRIVVAWASRRKATTRAEIAEALGVSTATVDLDRHETKS
jgi:DNA-binding NtrC family response regulator